MRYFYWRAKSSRRSYALELRFKTARSTVDIDLSLQTVVAATDKADTSRMVREMLQSAASIFLGDWFKYTIGLPVLDENTMEGLQSQTLVHDGHQPGRSKGMREVIRNTRGLGDSLPPARVLEHTIRYEAMLDRQMMRAVQWLEMLQQRRRSLEDQKGKIAKQTQIRRSHSASMACTSRTAK